MIRPWSGVINGLLRDLVHLRTIKPQVAVVFSSVIPAPSHAPLPSTHASSVEMALLEYQDPGASLGQPLPFILSLL